MSLQPIFLHFLLPLFVSWSPTTVLATINLFEQPNKNTGPGGGGSVSRADTYVPSSVKKQGKVGCEEPLLKVLEKQNGTGAMVRIFL